MSTNPHCHVIAVTGIYGSGKSTVSRMLEALGAYLVSADELAREVVLPGSTVLDEIARAFGQSMIRSDGSLNRKELASLAFSSEEKRRRLESITHPVISKLAEEEFSRAKDLSNPLTVYDCPLLFETGLEKRGFKKILLVVAEQALCLERVIRRDKIDHVQARKRFQAQMPLEEKKKLADIIIDNSGTLEELEQTVYELFQRLSV